MKKLSSAVVSLALLGSIALVLPACGEKEPETPGEALDKALDDADKSAKEANDAANKAMEDMKKDK